MAVDVSTRNRLIVMQYIDAATALLNARHRLKGLRESIEAHGAESVLTVEAFEGGNAQIDADDFPPFLAAVDALEELLVDPATGLPTDHLKALIKFQRVNTP